MPDVAAQAAYRKALLASLSGDPVAAALIRAGWQPIVDAGRHAQEPDEPIIPDHPTLANQDIVN